ncbi:Uncharacterised protein [uncultured archaeon]|nr:Uncharacterised protein [uncultured archaeon]
MPDEFNFRPIAAALAGGSLAIAAFMIIVTSAVAIAPGNSTEDNSTGGTVELQIIAFNDFHGQLEPLQGKMTLYYNRSCKPYQVEVGGVEYLATLIKSLKASNPNTVIVSAGDSIGASQLVSALFHDEPTIEALSEIGLQYSAAGNHEFDEGVQELMRMQYGCCSPSDGCQDQDRFTGAGYDYLTANVVNNTTGKTLFPPYKIEYIQGIPVAFIGVSLEGTPAIVSPSGVRGLKFLDEADSINGIVRTLKEKGIHTIIVLIHQGGSQNGLPSEAVGLSGPILNIVNRTDEEVDVFITGHTHQSYIAKVDGRIVSQAGSLGKLLSDIDLTISKDTLDVTSATAKNVAVTHDMPKDPEISEIVEKYSTLAAPLAERVIGAINASITRKESASGESALGNVIADAELHATGQSDRAVAAFTNSGGIRADLLYNNSSSKGMPENVTYEEAFSVQPFSNSLVTMNLTGTEIDELLEQQFGTGGYSILQVSGGFSYTWRRSAPQGQKVDISSIRIQGSPIDPSGVYRITVSSFLADGGDGFTVLMAGKDRVYGAMDLDALVDYFQAVKLVSPGKMDRITVAS